MALAAVPAAHAASHKDVTWLPCGAIRLGPGERSIRFILPRDYSGVLKEPMVFMALHVIPKDDESTTTRPATQPVIPRTPLVHMSVGDKRLPDWPVGRVGSAYAVNVKTIESNPAIAEGMLEVKFGVDISEGEVYFYAAGAPDPLLLGDALDGPLTLFIERATDPDVKQYFQALRDQFSGRTEHARNGLRKLRSSKDERVAAYARRGLRLLKGITRSKSEAESFASRYRWGLYFQQCGYFQKALEDFMACSELDGFHGPTWYRLAEMAERCGIAIEEVANVCERSGAAAEVADPTVWNVLVTILRERTVDVEEDGKKVEKKLTVSDGDIARLKEQWVYVEKMVFGASRGTLKLNTAYHEIKNEKEQAYTRHCGWLAGPTDDLIQVRGWFDSVISIRPHLPTEREETGGGDVGPNGCALSDLDVTADWQRMFRQWNHQFDWAVSAGEAGSGLPITDDAIGCGHSPIPSEGYGLRAAMRYYATTGMYRHAKIVPTTMPQKENEPASDLPTYVRYWSVDGPYPISETWPKTGRPAPHVMDTLPARTEGATRVIDSNSDFVDLKAALGDAGWCLARAECWVKSGVRQHVQMWLGFNDGASVRVNDRVVRQGRYYGTAKYEDRQQVDMVASYATLEPGWNRLEVVVESWPTPLNKGWGFSVRMTQFDGKPVPGLRFSARRPDAGIVPSYAPPTADSWYSWRVVQDAFHELLPRLTDETLAAFTGLRGLKIHGMIQGADGMAAIEVPNRKPDDRYRDVPRTWSDSKDRDTKLNNVLDWAREDVCAVRFEKDGRVRDLLILKPEAFEAYLTLLKEPSQAVDVYGQIAPADRIVGYIVVPGAHGSARTLLVADVLLSGEKEPWPVDEEDLLDPEQR